jgi:hypothetical protein
MQIRVLRDRVVAHREACCLAFHFPQLFLYLGFFNCVVVGFDILEISIYPEKMLGHILN